MNVPESLLQLINKLKRKPSTAFFKDWSIPTGIEYVELELSGHYFYLADSRFCDRDGEIKIAKIDLSETDRIDKLGIDWVLVENNVRAEIKADIEIRDKEIELLNQKLDKLKQTNLELKAL